MALEFCALCQLEKDLQESHLIPAFAIRWLKQTSATSHIRNATNPNRRIQDGLTSKLLCWDCEQKFSIAEKHFAENIFMKVKKENPITPDNGLMRYFVVSLSWRVTLYFFNKNKNLYVDFLPIIEKALENWRLYLLGVKPNLEFANHYLWVSPLIDDEAILNLDQKINLYLHRQIDAALISPPQEVGVGAYTLLPGIGIYSPLYPKSIENPSNSKIILDEMFNVFSDFGPNVVTDFILKRARRMSEIDLIASEKQRNIVTSAVLGDLDRFENSESYIPAKFTVALKKSK
ncbi:MAG: hypothetical protein RLZZ156_2694 [Deinococcota bacterium]|jgi:hypothetical protein